MLMLISPAKALDEAPLVSEIPFTEAEFLPQAAELIQQLQKLTPTQIADLMDLSTNLSELNFERFQSWQLPMGASAKPALFLFKGDVYQGIQAETLNDKSLSYLQSHLAILSGLYGVLKPQDLMLPYRLEMGTSFDNHKGKNLYQFWGTQITDWVNRALQNSSDRVLVNLASNEYFKVIQPKAIQGNIITPIFKDWKNGQYKIVSFYAKKARGLMARYAADHLVEQVEDLKLFDYEGYHFNAELSNAKDWVFTRKIDAE